jgi:hypothetical protein
MNFTELLREIWQTGKERVKNPILGAFIFSWIAINHDLIIILFSDLKPIAKIYFLQSYAIWWETTVLPFGIALVFRVIVSYVSWLQEYALKKAIKGRLEILKDNEALTQAREENKADNEYKVAQIRSGKREISTLQSEIDRLNLELEKLEKAYDTSIKIDQDNAEEIDKLRLDLKVQKELAKNVLESSLIFELKYYSSKMNLATHFLNEEEAFRSQEILNEVEAIRSNKNPLIIDLKHSFIKLVNEESDYFQDHEISEITKYDDGYKLFDFEDANAGVEIFRLSQTGKALFYALKSELVHKKEGTQ